MSHNRESAKTKLSELLKSYESGKITDAERRKIDRWIERTSSDLHALDPQQKASFQEEIFVHIKARLSPPSPTVKRHKFIPWSWAAAALVLLGASWWYIEKQDTFRSDSTQAPTFAQTSEWEEIGTQAGQRRKLGFPDGSTIWLNANSVLRYSKNFKSAQYREVYLDKGEAFFDISKDSARAFIVHTQHLENKVVGTSFNIKLQDNNGNYVLSMLSGEVELATNNSAAPQKTHVKKGNRATYGPTNNTIQLSPLEDQEWSLWTSNILSFKSATWLDLKQKLEEWYGVKVNINDKSDSKQLFTARFQNESLETVLKGLQRINSFSFQITEKEVLIE
jgi:transmembrane sensor